MNNKRQRQGNPAPQRIKVKGKPLYSKLDHPKSQFCKHLSMKREAKNEIERRPHLQVGQPSKRRPRGQELTLRPRKNTSVKKEKKAKAEKENPASRLPLVHSSRNKPCNKVQRCPLLGSRASNQLESKDHLWKSRPKMNS